MAEETVKACELEPGDTIRVELKGEELDVELVHVEEDELDGKPVVLLRFEVEGGFITWRRDPDQEFTRVASAPS